jgi:two-component system, NarL family, invasion response regulator UvrY
VIRVFVTDDHELLREGIKKVLKDDAMIAVMGEARSAAETLNQVRPDLFDVIVLDLSLPDRNGLSIIGELKQIDHHLAVLILSMHPESPFAESAFAAGADGYLTKETVSRSLVEAIRTVASGRKYVSSSLAELMASHLGDGEFHPMSEILSVREYEVFLKLAEGASPARIAKDCSLSLSTVYTYRSRIFQKTHMHSDAEIIHYALKHHLIE